MQSLKYSSKYTYLELSHLRRTLKVRRGEELQADPHELSVSPREDIEDALERGLTSRWSPEKEAEVVSKADCSSTGQKRQGTPIRNVQRSKYSSEYIHYKLHPPLRDLKRREEVRWSRSEGWILFLRRALQFRYSQNQLLSI